MNNKTRAISWNTPLVHYLLLIKYLSIAWIDVYISKFEVLLRQGYLATLLALWLIWVYPQHLPLLWHWKIAKQHVNNFYFIICLDLCVLFAIIGKIEVEHVISKKLQLKRKAEVSKSVIWVNKRLNLHVEHPPRGNLF